MLSRAELCRLAAEACGQHRRRSLASSAAAAAAGTSRSRGGTKTGNDDGSAFPGGDGRPLPPSLAVATPPVPAQARGAPPTTALSWLRRRGPLSPGDAEALFRKRAVRVERRREDEEGSGSETSVIGRVSALALLPAGARLLVPRSALEKKKKNSRSSSSPAFVLFRRGESSEGNDEGGSGSGGGEEEEEEEERQRQQQQREEDPATLALARRLRRRLLFSGPGFCVLDKPSGVHSQAGSRSEARGATLDAAAAAAASRGWLGRGMRPAADSFSSSSSSASSSSSSSAAAPLAARLVHRLDAPVSGAIAVAGGADAAARLARAFAAPSSALALLSAASSSSEEGEEEAGGEGEGGEGDGARRRRRKKLSSFLLSSPRSATPSFPSFSQQPPHSTSEIEISKTYLAIVDCVPYGTLLLSNTLERGEREDGDESEGGGGEGKGGIRRKTRGILDGPLPLSPVAGGAALKAVAHARAAAGSAAPPAQPPRAATAWRLLAASDAEGGGWALLALRPLTGRRHQLRKHCAGSFGSPVAGDERYGATRSPRGRMVAAVAERALAERARRREERERGREQRGDGESLSASSSPPAPPCSSPDLMLYCSSLTLRAPEGGVTVRARPPPHFEALATRLGFGRLVAARRRAAERSPATATGAFWRWEEKEREDRFDSDSSDFAPRPPRRAPRAARRPEWAL